MPSSAGGTGLVCFLSDASSLATLPVFTLCSPKKLCSETCEAQVSARMAFCFAVPVAPRNSLMNSRTVMLLRLAMCAAMYRRNRLGSYQWADVGHDGSHLAHVGFDALMLIFDSPFHDRRRLRCGFSHA